MNSTKLNNVLAFLSVSNLDLTFATDPRLVIGVEMLCAVLLS